MPATSTCFAAMANIRSKFEGFASDDVDKIRSILNKRFRQFFETRPVYKATLFLTQCKYETRGQ